MGVIRASKLGLARRLQCLMAWRSDQFNGEGANTIVMERVIHARKRLKRPWQFCFFCMLFEYIQVVKKSLTFQKKNIFLNMSSLFVFRERSLESFYGRVYSVEPRGVPVVPVLAGDVVGAAEDGGVAPELIFLLESGMSVIFSNLYPIVLLEHRQVAWNPSTGKKRHVSIENKKLLQASHAQSCP